MKWQLKALNRTFSLLMLVTLLFAVLPVYPGEKSPQDPGFVLSDSTSDSSSDSTDGATFGSADVGLGYPPGPAPGPAPKKNRYKQGKIEDWTKRVQKELYFMTAQFISRAIWFPRPSATPMQPPGPTPGPSKKPPVLLLAVHGTYAKDSPEFQKDTDPTFMRFRKFALKLAHSRQAPVLFMSFAWSGDNDEYRRKAAGMQLARLLNDSRFSSLVNVSEVVIIAHSHGGNVAHFASGRLMRPIDILVNLGTPRRDQEHYRPKRIRKLYNLYSTSDPVQVAGSVIKESMYSSMRSRADARRQPYRPGQQTINVDLRLNGTPPGHLVIKDVISGLHELLTSIDKHYKVHDHLIADVKIGAVYPEVIVAVNKYLSTRDLIARQDDIDLHAAGTLIQIAKEVDFSLLQEAKFVSRYQKELRSKGSMLRRITQSAIDMYRTIKYYLSQTFGGSDE